MFNWRFSLINGLNAELVEHWLLLVEESDNELWFRLLLGFELLLLFALDNGDIIRVFFCFFLFWLLLWVCRYTINSNVWTKNAGEFCFFFDSTRVIRIFCLYALHFSGHVLQYCFVIEHTIFTSHNFLGTHNPFFKVFLFSSFLSLFISINYSSSLFLVNFESFGDAI